MASEMTDADAQALGAIWVEMQFPGPDTAKNIDKIVDGSALRRFTDEQIIRLIKMADKAMVDHLSKGTIEGGIGGLDALIKENAHG